MLVAILADMKVRDLAILIAFGLLLAVIGVPRLQKSVTRSAEVSAIADSRRVVAAQWTYSAANGGYFDELDRLCRTGPDCAGIGIPDYPDDEPAFIDADLARPSPYRKDHYVRNWVLGAKVENIPVGVSPTSVLDFCYVSRPGDWLVRGGRSYAGRGNGSVCSPPERGSLCWLSP